MDLLPVIPVLLIILVVAILEILLYSIPLRIRVRLEHMEDAGTANISLLWLCLGIRAHLFKGNRNVQVLLGKKAIFSPQLPSALRSPVQPVETGHENMEQEAFEPLAMLESVIPKIPCIISFLVTTVKSISLIKVECRAEVGLSSPADTGIFYGYFCAFRSMFSYLSQAHMVMIPDFNRERLDGYLEVDLQVRHPFALIILLWRLSSRMQDFRGVRTTGGGALA